ncbi:MULTISPECIES: SDR family NAD(P)-dependent oxidoreductase [Nocardia]|uniref:SDR family NAD(P)-dependent oxidoreductase n=1 Tax=Nocardia TaxID=1817 RepID=UPI001358627F|nr:MULTISPECIES: SDR family oxidoreductase [Nocardia]
MTNDIHFDFTGTKVLVTGGTSGIGHATALLLRDAGADVIVTGTRSDAAEYDADLTGVDYRRLVLTDEESIDELVTGISTLDVLINNAGANFPGGLDERSPEGFERSVALNLIGTYRVTLTLREKLAASTTAGGGCVINLASMAALRAVPIVPGYGAAKAGVISLTRNLAVAWAGEGIRVNAVAPGTIRTPMTAPMRPETAAAELAHIPVGRFGAVDEIAPTIAFLCTAQSSYTSGAVFVVDGASDCV